MLSLDASQQCLQGQDFLRFQRLPGAVMVLPVIGQAGVGQDQTGEDQAGDQKDGIQGGSRHRGTHSVFDNALYIACKLNAG
jgi:hypothetical protein